MGTFVLGVILGAVFGFLIAGFINLARDEDIIDELSHALANARADIRLLNKRIDELLLENARLREVETDD